MLRLVSFAIVEIYLAMYRACKPQHMILLSLHITEDEALNNLHITTALICSFQHLTGGPLN